MTGSWEEMEHTADVAIRVEADSREELFEIATRGMFELMYGPLPAADASVARAIEGTGDGDEDLLWDWLSNALSWSEVDRAAFVAVRNLDLGPNRVVGVLQGVPAADRELAGPPIKAVTFHDLAVNRVGERWQANVVFDV